jgi:hypothetical protein
MSHYQKGKYYVYTLLRVFCFKVCPRCAVLEVLLAVFRKGNSEGNASKNRLGHKIKAKAADLQKNNGMYLYQGIVVG